MSSLLEDLGLSEESNSQDDSTQGIAQDAGVGSRAKKAWTIIGLTGIGIVIVGALLLLIASLVIPEKTNTVVMEATTKVQAAVQKAVPALEPDVVLGRNGGQHELDVCDGTWINQDAYVEILGKPSYSAHNGCKGGLILEKGVGDIVNVRDQAGNVKKYKVVEDFSLPAETTQITDLKGHRGEIMLQTCHWDLVTLKFLTLDPVAGS